MYRVINSTEDIFAMAKLSAKYADKSITGEFGDFIYFSRAQHTAGPRIKFNDGGDLKGTLNAPSLTFDSTGPKDIIGDVKKYPLLKQTMYINTVRNFVDAFKSLFLLVWYGYLDESDLQKYFEGSLKWDKLISFIEFPDDVVFDTCESLEDLEKICIKNNLYTFPSRR